MSVHNSDVTAVLNELADLLEIEGANEFRVRAYRNAARTIDSLPQNLTELVDRGEELAKLPDIGHSMAEKIEEIIRTGHLQQLEELEQTVPAELSDLLSLSGLGPKRVQQLHEELDIHDRQELMAAAQAGKVRQLKGLGPKTEQKMLDELAAQRDSERRRRRAEVEEIAESLLGYLRQVQGVKQAVIAGSYRRCKETVGDVDILVTCKYDSPVMKQFVTYDEVKAISSTDPGDRQAERSARRLSSAERN